jgi:hypothetical protein
MAANLTAGMFDEAGTIGLDLQLVYYRGAGECRASGWMKDANRLKGLMTGVACRSGITQIGSVLGHAAKEAAKHNIRALVFIGDCFEEDFDRITPLAAELGAKGIPAFMFQEGGDTGAAVAFRRIAELSNGVWAKFDAGAASELGRLLRAAIKCATATNKAEALSELRSVAGLLGKR